MNSHLVATMVIGAAAEKLYALSSDSIKKYAQKINADFVCINENLIDQSRFQDHDFPVHYNKLKIGDYLENYERVLYLDCDLIIKPDTPNLFEIVSLDAIGVMNEGIYADYNQEIQAVKNVFGQLDDWQKDYFNSGVMVISKIHRQLFETPTKLFLSPFYEQTYLNWKARDLNYKIEYISDEFNFIFKNINSSDLNIPESANIVHFAGWGFALPVNQNSHKYTYKYHQMRCFLDYLDGKKTFRIHPEQLSLNQGFIDTKTELSKLLVPPKIFDLISYGPYLAIKAGLYNILINFKVTNLQVGEFVMFKFDVVSDSGNQFWYRNDVKNDSCFEFTLQLPDINDLEFRFFGTGVEFELNFIELLLN